MYVRAVFQKFVLSTCAFATASGSATAKETYVLTSDGVAIKAASSNDMDVPEKTAHIIRSSDAAKDAYVLTPDGVATKAASSNGMGEPGKIAHIIRSQQDTLDMESAPNYQIDARSKNNSLLLIRDVPNVPGVPNESPAAPKETNTEEVRQLVDDMAEIHDAGYEDWGHSAGYVTDFLIAATCCVCLMVPRAKRNIPHLTEQFVLLLMLEGGTFGFAGLAHSRIDAYHHAGVTMGTKWGHPNSFWMLPWLASQICTGFLSSAILTFSYWAFPMGFFGAPNTDAVPTVGAYPVAVVAYVIGGYVSFKEAHSFMQGDIKTTGTLNGCWSLASTFLTVVSLAVGLYMRGDRKGMWFPHFPEGHLIALFGTALMFPAFLVRARTPASCNKTGEGREDCPFPEAFNQNAIFHTLIMASVLISTAAVWVKFEAHKPSQTRKSAFQKDRRLVNQWYSYLNDFLAV